MKHKTLSSVMIACLMMYACSLDHEPSQMDPSLSGARHGLDGQYIVVFNTEKTGRATQHAGRNYQLSTAYSRGQATRVLEENGVSAAIDRVYSQVLDGFAASLTAQEYARLSRDERVLYIEPDGEVIGFSVTEQSPAPWGLDRVDQRELPLNSIYSYDATGAGVTAYILDSGIRPTHNEFGGRVRMGFDAFGGNSEDCHGHGTHVAGTVGGATYGVAKEVELVSVKVLGCTNSGSWSGVIAGMDWAVADAPGPAVANMSIGGGGTHQAVNDAVQRMVDAGIPVIVAAGNNNADACNYTPAWSPGAYTVGATTNTDERASFSNYGKCVNIFAPGVSITSASYTTDDAAAAWSGTSMASPHVAGAAALYLQHNTSATAQDVYGFLTANSTQRIVSNSRTSNNHLVYTLVSEGEEDNPDDRGPALGDIDLSVTTFKDKGFNMVTLTWTGANLEYVDIWRNSVLIATVPNSGTYTDHTNTKGKASHAYFVCETGTLVCSSVVFARF
jgi:subtilisin family serine protease